VKAPQDLDEFRAIIIQAAECLEPSSHERVLVREALDELISLLSLAQDGIPVTFSPCQLLIGRSFLSMAEDHVKRHR
jgi:hypothetical protein